MLDLKPGIHLEEIELAFCIEQELAGPGVHIARGPRGAHRGLSHPAAQFGCYGDAWRLLDHLLVPPLHRAFPLA